MKEKQEAKAAQLAYEYAIVDKKLEKANQHLKKNLGGSDSRSHK
jgi:hypothetical protein